MSKIQYVFDIETVSENESDVMKSAWDPVERKMMPKYTPHPIKEKIMCISLLNVNYETDAIVLCGDNEKLLLEQFWSSISSADELIGFNSNNFDLQYIIIRSLYHKLKIKKDVKYVDVRDLIYLNNKYMKGNLSDFAGLLGIAVSTENGSKMREFYISKNWDKIKAHCVEDVSITKELYLRCRECNLAE